jgi:hypothetical protein
MSRQARLCEDPRHEGDRFVTHAYDLYELRAELRRLHDDGRERTRTIRRLCRTCAFRLFEDEPALMQTTLGGIS